MVKYNLKDLSIRLKNSPKKYTEQEIKIANKLLNKYGNKYYQYTVIDEYNRCCYRQMYE